jgi:[NiFe] hydrogenase assembly HybE family chaperone
MTATAGDLLDARVRALVALYREIAATRMRGLPLLNPALQVRAVGFELVSARAAEPDGTLQPSGAQAVAAPEQAAAVGVLITPWFMNLVWLPLQRLEAAAHVGRKVTRHVGQECFEFIGAHEDGFGGYEACSLFSPVFEFQSQQAAVETARAVLDALRQPKTAAVPVPAVAPAQSPEIPQAPARRAFLFGRSAAANQAARPAVQPHEVSGRG